MEIWDLLDGDRRPLGMTHPRGQDYPLPAGAYHLAVTVLTMTPDGRLLLTRRAPTKRLYPGYWELTAGSAVAGETSLEAAARELREETGLVVAQHGSLEQLGSLREPTAFMDVYLLRTATSAEDTTITLQEGETVDHRWVDLLTFESLLHDGQIPPPVAMRYGVVRQALMDAVGTEYWDVALAQEVSHG